MAICRSCCIPYHRQLSPQIWSTSQPVTRKLRDSQACHSTIAMPGAEHAGHALHHAARWPGLVPSGYPDAERAADAAVLDHQLGLRLTAATAASLFDSAGTCRRPFGQTSDMHARTYVMIATCTEQLRGRCKWCHAKQNRAVIRKYHSCGV